MQRYDLIIIGAGISGMTAAMGAANSGVKKILIIEKESSVGGIINQCIHNGFGEKFLGEQVTGPEYIDYIQKKTKIKTKGNKNGRYKVKIVKEKINKIRYIGKDFFRILNEENGFDKNKILEGNFEHFEKYLAYFQVMLQFKFSNKKLLRIYEDFNYYANNQKDEILVNFNEIYLKNKYIINVDAMLENKTIINRVNLFDLIFKDLTTTISYYKVVDFKIYDKLKKEVIYNKKDFTFEMNQELSCMDIWKDEFAKEKYLEDLYGKDFFSLEVA